MDRVRFGRALGYGARHAAKALVKAADAAATPGTTAKPTVKRQPTAAVQETLARTVATRQTSHAAAGIAAAQAARTGKTLVSNVGRASRALFLEVTGTFFALFAFAIGAAVWHLRASLGAPLNTTDSRRAYFALILALLFAYFSISSFVRARRVQRR